MNLKDAIDAVAPVVGDGRLVFQHAYVMVRDGTLHATDGRQWCLITLEDTYAVPDFYVRYEPLKRALEREYTAVGSDGDNGLVIRYGRGRARLKGITPDHFPMREMPGVQKRLTLPAEFTNRVKELLPFCANGDGHVWQQAIHLQSGFIFAANSFALIKCPMDWIDDDEMLVGVPTWACKFIANRPAEPVVLNERGQLISFMWPGIALYTTLMTQQAPDNIIEFAAAIAEPAADVPEGLKEAVDRIESYGGKTCKIGGGGISYDTEAVELMDSVSIGTPVKTWGVDSLSAALVHATKLDLTNTHATWTGSGYVGIFAGRSD